MKRRLLGAIVALAAVVLFAAVGAITAANVPDNITINNEGYAADKKGPVDFTHKKHTADYKVACTDCHHVFKDGKNVWKEGDAVQKCKECHDPNEKKGNADKLQNAYHANCKNCHKDLMEAGKAKNAPFKKCNDCHKGKD